MRFITVYIDDHAYHVTNGGDVYTEKQDITNRWYYQKVDSIFSPDTTLSVRVKKEIFKNIFDMAESAPLV